MEGRRRLTLLEQMSATSNGRTLAGLSLDDVLTPRVHKPPPPAPAIPESISGRTLLDIIRDEEPKSYRALIGKKDKKTWKTFKDRLRLNAWVSSPRVPTSDIHPVRNNYHHQGYSYSRPRRYSVTYVTPEPQPMAEPGQNADNTPTPIIRSGSNPSFARRSSVRLSAVDDVEPPRRRREAALGEERSMSAREAVAAQQAAEAAAAAAAAEGGEGEEEGESSSENVSAGIVTSPEPEPVRMSLMDLLEETDRQMGLEGSRYMMDSDEEDEEEEEEEEEEAVEDEGGGVEHSCGVCMVRHKGAALIPCGHTFCRLCSKELLAQRGNCPLCNNYILEILNIF